MYNIRIEDLTANAFIETLKRKEKRFLTYSEIEKYGEEVVKILNDKGKQAILILSRDNTDEFLYRYSKYFKEKIVDNKYGIELNKTITIYDLIENFRGYLSLSLALGFVDEKAIQVLEI